MGYNGIEFAAADISATLDPPDRMESLECAVEGLILPNLRHSFSWPAVSSKINDTLIEAANCMLITW